MSAARRVFRGADDERGGNVPEGGYVSRRLLQLVMPSSPTAACSGSTTPRCTRTRPAARCRRSACSSRPAASSSGSARCSRTSTSGWSSRNGTASRCCPTPGTRRPRPGSTCAAAVHRHGARPGTAVSGLRLSGGVGNYEVRVYARYRETVVQMYDGPVQPAQGPAVRRLPAREAQARGRRAVSGPALARLVTAAAAIVAAASLTSAASRARMPVPCTGALVDGWADRQPGGRGVLELCARNGIIA
jgi:hypothetical protein